MCKWKTVSFALLLFLPDAAHSARTSPEQKCNEALNSYLTGVALSQRHAMGSEITIDAPPQRVWEVLEDFEKYPEWNPMSAEVHTDRIVGHRMWLLANMGEGQTRKVGERLIAYERDYCLSWKVPFPENIFAGGHRWQLLIDLGDGRTRFVSYEKLGGMLVSYVDRKFGSTIQKNYHAMVLALKNRVESLR